MAVVSLRLLSFLCCLLVITISQARAQPDKFPFLDYFCISNTSGNYTANSTYQTNLNTLLSGLTSNTEVDYGFYNLSYGQNTDKVNAIGLCRGDVRPHDCRSCLNDIRVSLTKVCPNEKEAIGWYDNCMLRYAQRSIFGIMETTPTFYVWNLNKASKVDQFNHVLNNLLDSLRSTAASGDSHRKYAVANATGPDNQIIYGLVQCTPDLSGPDCNNCLAGAISDHPQCCNDKIGGRVIRPSCNFRYEISRFYEPTADAPPPSLHEPPADTPSPSLHEPPADTPPPSLHEPPADAPLPSPSSTFSSAFTFGTSPLLLASWFALILYSLAENL